MATKSLVLPLVVSAVVHAGAAPGVGQLVPRGAESGAREPASPTALAQKSSTDRPQGPADTASGQAAGPILKRWVVPPLEAPAGRLHIPQTNSAAISDDGTRVIIDNHPAVDVWDMVKGTCVRAQSTQDWGMGCNVIIARDASYFYVRNDTTKKVEAHDERGSLIGSRPQIGFAPPFGLKRPGYDFAPHDYIMGSRLPADCGIFVLDPKTGAQRIVVRIKSIWDVERCQALVQRPGGDFLGYYKGEVANQRRGLHVIARNGRLTKIPGIPSGDMKVVSRMSLSPDGRYLALQGQDRLQVWDHLASQLVHDWRQEYRTPCDARFTGDGRLAVLSLKTSIKEVATSGLTGGYVNHTARLDVLEIPSLRVAGELDLSEFDGPVPAFAFSPSGKQLVVADSEQVALVDVGRTFPAK